MQQHKCKSLAVAPSMRYWQLPTVLFYISILKRGYKNKHNNNYNGNVKGLLVYNFPFSIKPKKKHYLLRKIFVEKNTPYKTYYIKKKVNVLVFLFPEKNFATLSNIRQLHRGNIHGILNC